MSMSRLGLVAASLLLTSACSAFAADECGMSGDWYSYRWAHNHSGQVTWTEDGSHQGMNLISNTPVSFSSDGIITGGRHDGVFMGGGIVATTWECQGADRFILKGNILDIQERIQVNPEGFWEFAGGGRTSYFVKADDTDEAAERILDFMKLRAEQRGRVFRAN